MILSRLNLKNCLINSLTLIAKLLQRNSRFTVYLTVYLIKKLQLWCFLTEGGKQNAPYRYVINQQTQH